MTKQFKPLKDHRSYHARHPWYYLLGGDVPTPKQIQANAIASDYCGYKADDIRKLDKQSEPKRSDNLRKWQAKFREDLKFDISIYREVVRELHQYRESQDFNDIPPCCDDIHTSMSLKFAHLYNDFAHLNFLDELLGGQMDLFGI